jgi:2-oxoglutarate dehydrogenase E2 component (dihydrolipoamide succinyltransferase)
MKSVALLVALFALSTGCTAANKAVARTVLDVARSACDLYASQAGLSISDVCATEQQLAPFIDSILAAQAAASSQRAGGCGAGASAPAPSAAPVEAPAAPPVAPAAPAATPAPAAAPAAPAAK